MRLSILQVMILSAAITAAAPAVNAAPAAAPSGSPVSIVHNQLKGSELPYPGQTIVLIARLTNTKDTERSLRLSYVKDGRIMEVAARDAFLDEYDRPTYQIPVPAPLAELVYQFTLVNSDGSFTTSKRFSARRSCLPSVELSNPKAIESLEGTERMTALIEQAKSLENDLIGYQRVMELLESIDKAVAK